MGKRLVALVPVLVFVLVSALSVGAFFIVRNSVETQQANDLDRDTSQLALVLQVAVQQITAGLRPIAAVAAATNDSAKDFEAQAKAVTTNPAQSVALVQSLNGAYIVKLAAGPSLVVGQTLPPLLARIASNANVSTLGTSVFTLSGHKAIGFAIGPPYTLPGQAMVETSIVDPSLPAKNESGPYKQLNLALYASAVARPSNLIASTTGIHPLSPPISTAYITITGRRWLVLTSAKGPLVGASLRSSQWLVLVVGLLLGLLTALLTETIARRKAYAEAIAEERTQQLTASQDELVRAERLAAIGELATVVGHELRNPLGASTNALFLARQQLGPDIDPALDRHLSMIDTQMHRAVTLCEDLTSYARQRDPNPVDIDVRALIDDTLVATPPPAGIAVSVDAGDVHVEADLSMLMQVLTNLVTNAYQAMPEGGSLRFSAATGEFFDTITLVDSGKGIPPDVVGHLFEPFFTTKTEGTGLGLPIVKGIVQAHGGSISIENAPGGGANVTVHLPRAMDGKPRKPQVHDKTT